MELRSMKSSEGAPLAGPRPSMRRHEVVVLIQLDLDVGRADPEPLADEASEPAFQKEVEQVMKDTALTRDTLAERLNHYLVFADCHQTMDQGPLGGRYRVD
jgi:hypothetical protein